MSGDALNTQSPGPGNGGEPAPGVGRLLRASRLRCGEELSDVAGMLRIRYAYLEAIEEDRFQDLPGQAYAIGFIRAYAEHLGLDSGEVVRRFKEDSAGVEKTNLDFPVPFPEKGIPGGAILFVGVAIAVLAYGGWYLNTTYEGRFMDLISPLPERLASLAGKDDAAEAGPSPVTATADELTPAATGDGGQAQATTEPGPRESGVEQGIGRIPPRFGPETAAEVTLSPGPPAEAAVTPPGTIETDRGSGLAPVPAEAEGGGPGEAVPAEEGAAKLPEAADALGTARGEGEAPGIGRPDAATGAEEETPATGGPERATAEAQVQGETRPAMGDAEPDAAGTEQAAAPPATGEVEQDTAGTEQAAEPPATGDAGQAPAAPAADEPEQAAVQPAAASSRGRVFGADSENSRIEVRAIMNSWIQVRDDADNRLLVTRMLRAGDSYRVPDRRGLKLLTGNAGALEILVDGEVVPSIGPVGKVLRAVALDSERLRRGSAVDD